MIASLEGMPRVLDLGTNQITIMVKGVGYLVTITPDYLQELWDENPSGPIEFPIFTVYKEGDVFLYGFRNREERQMFGFLLKARGVGPSIAMLVISELSVSDIIDIVAKSDKARLLAIRGIGDATADNILKQLKKEYLDVTGT